MKFLSLLFLSGIALTGCARQNGTILGQAPSGTAHSIVAIRSGDTPSRVVVNGTLVEKCPVAGCWFYVQDSTGVIKVDSKTAGFVVVDVPLQSRVSVGGQVGYESDLAMIKASGLRIE